jgi:integrase
MSNPSLTSAAVRKLRAGKDRREIPDGGCPGLRLVIQPSGSKSWCVRFRRPSGQPAKLTLGTCDDSGREGHGEPVIGGHLTLVAARRLAAETRRQLALGRDPAAAYLAQKQRARVAAIGNSANTFAAAAKDFIERYSRKRVRRWKEQARLLGLYPKDLTLIPKGLAERWHDRPVSEISDYDIHAIVDEVRRQGVPGLEQRSDGESENRARHVFAVLSVFFDWLRQHRRVNPNPCANVHRPAAAKARDRVLTNGELIKFWAATNTVGEPFGPVLKLLLLIGARLNEVAGMRHDELSEDGTQWMIPGNRTKNHRPHVVPLPPLARDILASVRRIENSDLVFTTTGKTPISGWSTVKIRLDALMGDLPHWIVHDLRRSTATHMAEIGIPPHIVEACLNHISGAKASVAGVYNRAQYSAEKKAAFERWATHVEGLVLDKPAAVVPLRARP